MNERLRSEIEALHKRIAGLTARSRKKDEIQADGIFEASIIDSSDDAIIGITLDGAITSWNNGAERIYGYASKEVIGRDISMTIPEDRPDEYGEILQKIKNHVPISHFETRRVRKDGTQIDVSLTISPILGRDGSIAGASAITRDITAHREAERKLENARMEAELYIDLMSHDINNMNQIALGFLELALEKLEKDHILGMKDKILLEKPFETLKSNSRLIDNVRKIRKEKSGTIKPELIDLGEILAEVKRQYTCVSHRAITINYIPVKGCRVTANELLLDVFLNLAGNAVKHSSGPLTINLTLEKEWYQGRKFYKVAVEDNGPGIPDDMKQKLLDEACLKRARKSGKGFGLCLTRTLLEDFNGSISIENTVPLDHTRGSRFVVLLPAANE